MASDFGEIPRNEHLPARIALQFAQRIQKGALRPGDKLPTEHALAKSFGVSRTVIREAIAQLRNEGLVETRQGIGAFVTERPTRHIRLDDGDQMDRHAFRNLYQLRLPLEIEAAGLAAIHHSPEHLRLLGEALERMSIPEDWVNTGLAADQEFHRILADATGNEYFSQFIGAISDRISHVDPAPLATVELGEIIDRAVKEHAEIRDAVAARDPLRARGAMRRHLAAAAERIGLKLELYL